MPLSRAVHESRFGRAVRKDVPAVNPGASFELVPISGRQWRELRRQHKGCASCNGFGVTRGLDEHGAEALVRCPECRGEGTFLDSLETRMKMLKSHVRGWDGVKLYEDGVPICDLGFDESGLQTIAETDTEFLAVVMACIAAGVEVERLEGKASASPPSDGSEAGPSTTS